MSTQLCALHGLLRPQRLDKWIDHSPSESQLDEGRKLFLSITAISFLHGRKSLMHDLQSRNDGYLTTFHYEEYKYILTILSYKPGPVVCFMVGRLGNLKERLKLWTGKSGLHGLIMNLRWVMGHGKLPI